ncbi:hypothetical protein PAXINDRAFT_20292 [Paxillus involutus ATCC 200175]|uniref:Uncharacterized protein n=1 Tax=Paxillus involutus ATCC 200175 TaxID=664439 RepID=A0A0C9SVA9_PAXIN|nr:hypothetical protein PAXINDRAFT_20292 [Paxillus involutus ATCC 200175]
MRSLRCKKRRKRRIGWMDNNVGELLYRSHESRKQQEPHLPTGSPTAQAGPSSHAKLSGSNSHTGTSTHHDGPSTPSNASPEERPSSSTPFTSGSLQADERTKKEKKGENALNHPANMAVDEVDIRRAIVELREQIEQLRRRSDDPQCKTEEEAGLEKIDDIKAGATTYSTADEADLRHINLQLGRAERAAPPTTCCDG